MKQFVIFTLRIMPIIFGCSVAAIALLTMIPSVKLPNVFDFWDKAQHILGFATLSLIGSLAYPKKTKVIYASLILYGAGIEVVQKYFTKTHVADIYDLFADSLGVVIGIIIYFVACKIMQRLASNKSVSSKRS